MPVSKKRKKEDARKGRTRDHAAPAAPAAPAGPEGPSGLLGRMRGGLRNVAGSGSKKPESLLSKVLTWALVLIVAWFAAKRLGIIP
jgi:hypothetical protein